MIVLDAERFAFQQRLEAASPKLATGLYIDKKGVKRRTGLSASFALSSALGSPRSSPETDPVARIASPISPDGAVQEADTAGVAFVGQDLDVGDSAVVVDGDVHVVPAVALVGG
jgi:hypothetical protein